MKLFEKGYIGNLELKNRVRNIIIVSEHVTLQQSSFPKYEDFM